MKNKLLLLFFFLFLNCSKDKKSYNENIKFNDSVDIFISKINKENQNKFEKEYCEKKLFIYLKNSRASKKNLERIEKIAEINYSKTNIFILKKFSCLLLEKAKERKDTLLIGKAYSLLGRYNIETNENDSAFYYFTKAEKIFYNYHDTISLSKNFINKANIQIIESDYIGGEQSSFSALKYSSKNDVKSLYNIYNFIGMTSDELGNYTNSLTYYRKALEVAYKPELLKFNLAPSCLNNIGYVYQNMNNHSKAIEHYKKGLKADDLYKKNPGLYAMLTDNYAYSKLKLDDFNELPGLFYVSLKIREKNQLNQGIILSKIHLSEYYNEVKDTFQSKKFAYEALKLARSTKVSGDILASLKHISTVDKKNLTQFYKEYIKLSDSIQNEERKAKDRFARIAYETDEVIQKNTELEVINRSLVFFLIGIGGIFSLLYVVITQKMRNRELAFKQEQQATNQEIYNMMILHQEKVDATSNYEKNRMAQELHDGVLSKMFGTRMNLDSLNEANDEETIAVRHKYIQELKSIEQEIREISHDLSSVKGKIINNFVLIVIELLEEQKKSFTSDLVYSIEKTMSWEKLDNTAKINFYRILQESLQNSNKYANAKTITVSFFQTEENITMKVEDDGIGFDVAKKKKGIGLKNMISRTEESNGIYELISKQGKGTITTVSIPYNKESPTQTL